MLLALAQWLQNDASFLRVFSYLTFRAVMATMTALVIGLVCGPWVIRKLTQMKVGQAVRTNGPQTHLVKSGTPTMGGVLILIAHRRFDAAVGRSDEPLRLDRDAGDVRLRRDRLGRRLAQGRPQGPARHALAREVFLAVGDRSVRGGLSGVQRVGGE